MTPQKETKREPRKLNSKQIHALRQYAKITDNSFRYPFDCGDSAVRASTCFALKRRGLLEGKTESWDWTKFRITPEGRKELLSHER